MSLKCGEQVDGPNVLMRSDEKSCAEMPASRIDVKLPTAIDHLFKTLPPLRNLVNYDNSKPAKEELVSNFRLEVMKNSDMPKSDIEVEQIAQPILTKLPQLKPIYEQQFGSTINWQISAKIGIISFILNVLLHTAISYWVKLRAKVRRMHPFRVKENRREIRSRPVVAVIESDYEFLRANPEHPLMRKTCVFPIDGSEYSAAQASAPDSSELENATSFKQLRKYIQILKDSENGRKNQNKNKEDQ